MAQQTSQETDRYQMVDEVGAGGDEVVIYDKQNPDAWVQSDYAVEVAADG
jgi:hypothetical protein